MTDLNKLQNEIETLKAQLEIERLRAELKDLQADTTPVAEAVTNQWWEGTRPTNIVKDSDLQNYPISNWNKVPCPTDEQINNDFYIFAEDGRCWKVKNEVTMWKNDVKPGWAKALGF